MNHLILLNIANFIFNFSRMLSGAIFIIILEDQGITLSTISLAKGGQLLTSMLFVLPSGIIADKYGGKYAILTACIFSIFYYYFLIEPTHEKVIIGEICNGVALAFYTGAYESWLFSLISQKDALNLHTHLARSRELSYLAIVFGGLIGTFISGHIFSSSLILMAGSLIIFLMIKKREENNQIQIQEKTKYFISAFKNLVSKRIGFFLLTSSFLVGGSMQLIYQFWQPFFFKFPDLVDSKQSLGLIFIAFMLTQYFTSKLIRKYVLKSIEQMIYLTGLCWGIASILLLNTILTENFISSIVCFCLFFGMAAVASNLLMAQLGEIVEARLQATAISILDLLGKSLGSSLLIFGDGIVTLSQYSFGWPILIYIFCPLSLWSIVQRKKLCTTQMI
ncbi:MAG: MFS transporter [Parachlamydiales bacterium]|jgi:MFS family permease